MDTTAPPDKPVGALISGLAVVRYLSTAAAPVGVSRIARDLGLNSSTCFNLLKTLVHERLATFDEATKTYRVPPMPFSLSINQLRELVGRVPGLKAVHDVAMPAGRGFAFKTVFPAFWQFGPMKPFRGVYALLDFG